MKITAPNRDSLCVMLAGGDHRAGFLLHKICFWYKYSRARIPKVSGKWIANNRAWWAREAQLSSRQCDRALQALAARGLVEKRQWWWGTKNILYIRPTAQPLAFLATVNTWIAAHALLADTISDALESAKSGSPTMPELASSNGISKSGSPSLPISAISKDIKNDLVTTHKTHPGEVEASLPFTTSDPKSQKNSGEVLEKENLKEKFDIYKSEIQNLIDEDVEHDLPELLLPEVVDAWNSELVCGFSEYMSAGLLGPVSQNQKCQIAEFMCALCPEDQPFADKIVRFAIKNWKSVAETIDPYCYSDVELPSPGALMHSKVIKLWKDAGC